MINLINLILGFFKPKPTYSPPPYKSYYIPEVEVRADDAITTLDSKNDYSHFTAKSTHTHNLKKMVLELDEEYFDYFFSSNSCVPRISWWWRGAKSNSKDTIGGLAFVDYNEILVNVRFNSKNISRDSVKLLVYHEMLHIKLYMEGRPFGHTREFNRREREFKGFATHDKDMELFFSKHIIGKPLGSTNFKKPKTIYTSKRFKLSPS